MAPKVATVVKTFMLTVDIEAEPRPAVDWLTDMCVAHEWMPSREEALEWAERSQAKFLNDLRRESSLLAALGRFAPFAFNSSSEYMLQGFAFIEPKDPDDVREAKTRRSRFRYYTETLRQLSPDEFEALSTGVLDLMRVESPTLTQKGKDEGIDFFGRLHLEGVLFPKDIYPTIQRQLAVWMIGQAKHYMVGQVSTPDIRQLVGSIELARGQTYAGPMEKYEELRIRVCDPVFYLFFTTGRISSDGWRLLDRSGVVGMDGEMVASFLADREIGITNGEPDIAEFRDWIKRYSR